MNPLLRFAISRSAAQRAAAATDSPLQRRQTMPATPPRNPLARLVGALRGAWS